MRRLITILFLIVVLAGKAGAQEAMPFIHNYSANEFHAHNRNFDILCCGQGRVLVANFEGLLLYDGVTWKMIHTPAISRITTLYRDSSGKLWFGGYNVLGTIRFEQYDSVAVNYIIDDRSAKEKFGEVLSIYEKNGGLFFVTASKAIYKVKGKDIKKAGVADDQQVLTHVILQPSANDVYKATAQEGLIATRNNADRYRLNAGNGLCSNGVSAIDYDGNGSVWGATSNGIFRVSTSSIYTHFDEHNGLDGQVMSIVAYDDKVYVATMTGVYVRKGNVMTRIPQIHQACWKLECTPRSTILAATPEGVFEFSGDGSNIRQLTTRHTISVMSNADGSYYSGEVDGLYLNPVSGNAVKLLSVNNACLIDRDSNGAIWTQTLYGETYTDKSARHRFVRTKEAHFSSLFQYAANGYRWDANKNGNGLHVTTAKAGAAKSLDAWLNAIGNLTVRAACDDNGVLWIGGTFGVIRFEYLSALKQKLAKPVLQIRRFKVDGRELDLSYSLDLQYPIGKTLYSYRLTSKSRWSAWSENMQLHVPNLDYGSHQIQVRAMDPYGTIVESEVIEHYVEFPIFVRWYSLLFYIILISFCIYMFFKIRTKRILEENMKLEAIVTERTQQVLLQKEAIEMQAKQVTKQKEEIEKQAGQLRQTLSELENAQAELIRKEREATVGKLTQGLIDRILNPMNYINNFSHLSLGLVKDMVEDIEDEKDAMSEDNYEDCMDLVDMLKQNLTKINDHGLATTRILKSMEEMLRDRSGTLSATDLTMLCNQNYEMLLNYYKQDITALGIKVAWNKPEHPIWANIIAEHVSKCIMSLINNSVFAIRKRKEQAADYIPELYFALSCDDEKATIVIRDNGIGIEESILPKIFDPFFTTKPTAEASGVGLYLTHQIVQDYGGTISVKSEKYNYTEFTITFPRTSAPEQE